MTQENHQNIQKEAAELLSKMRKIDSKRTKWPVFKQKITDCFEELKKQKDVSALLEVHYYEQVKEVPAVQIAIHKEFLASLCVSELSCDIEATDGYVSFSQRINGDIVIFIKFPEVGEYLESAFKIIDTLDMEEFESHIEEVFYKSVSTFLHEMDTYLFSNELLVSKENKPIGFKIHKH